MPENPNELSPTHHKPIEATQRLRQENGQHNIDELLVELETSFPDVSESYHGIQTELHQLQEPLSALYQRTVGVDHVSSVVINSLAKQCNQLLESLKEVKATGQALVFWQGKYKKIQDSQSILGYLKRIKKGLGKVNQDLSSEDKPDQQLQAFFDKQITDNRNIELSRDKSIVVAVYGGDATGAEDITGLIADEHIVVGHATAHMDARPKATLQNLVSEVAQGDDRLPDVVVLPYSDANHDHYMASLSSLALLEERPVVICYSPNKIPRNVKNGRSDVLIAQGEEALLSQVMLARDAVVTSKLEPAFMNNLPEKQAKLYRNADLREWEQETADTKQGLLHLVRRIKQLEKEKQARGGYQPLSILEMGVGHGRISVPLAVLGYNVVGLDLVPQIDSVEARLQREVAGINGDPQSGPHSYEALKEVCQLLGIELAPPIDVDQVASRLKVIYGDFQEAEYDVADGLKSTFTIAGLFEYLGQAEDLYSYEPITNLWGEVGFDVITYPWHTACELGGLAKQIDGLRQNFLMLKEGGILHIEIPDRMVDPYATSLNEYHARHPEYPLGTIQDETSTEAGVSTTVDEEEGTPRFFPDKDQMVMVLKGLGFINVNVEVYYITHQDQESGKTYLQVREYVITAQKPWE